MMRMLTKHFSFSTYQYYRQIASFLKIQIPKINQQLNYLPNTKCTIFNLKIQQQFLDPIQIPIQSNQINIQSSSSPSINQIIPDLPVQIKQQQTDLQSIINSFSTINQETQQKKIQIYKYQTNSSERLDFSEALKAAHHLNMDLCFIKHDPQTPMFNLTPLKKSVYRHYYNYLIKQRRVNEPKSFKVIKVSDNIQMNDMLTKVERTKNHKMQGIMQFKLIGQSSSQVCQNNIKKICNLLGKPDVEPILVKQNKKMKKNNDPQQNWQAYIFFDEEIPLDIEYIQKKWRRFEIQQRKVKRQKPRINFEGLSIESLKGYLNSMREFGEQFPPQYQDIQEGEKQFIEGKFKNWFKFQQKGETVSEIIQKLMPKEQQNQAEELSTDTKKIFRKRTVEEILEQIQSIKHGKHSLTSFEIFKTKQLENQLKNTLKAAGYTQKY